MLYKTMAVEKITKMAKIFEMDYPSKASFIRDLRSNGYSVNPKHVKTAEGYDYVIDNTNCQEWDWEAVK